MAARVTNHALSSLDLPASESIAFTRVRIVAALELQSERGTFEFQCAPKKVDQVALVMARQTLGPIAVNYDDRRMSPPLMCVP